ncbi:Flagellar biosynthesis chaperone [Yersinia bercovieri ATCC 43970]|uniref:Flagellar FliJ protein n=1 Tax=Yersinia bercovieri ATCC 43970 TaxID=349968 RepID=A0ABM9Y3F0_YERBE|nr:Flagellar biosynthesis chaperone [Yersinia bercovieri ATCC 43970]
MQQVYTQATIQHEQLESFELEYQQQLRANISGKGILIADLLNRQSFIDSLGQVVKQHAGHVEKCQNSVEETLLDWKRDKKRLNAFETLKSRGDAARLLKENRLEQKMMDEFAQRASMGKKIL